MSKFSEIEEQVVEDLTLDYTPLHYIVRIFSGMDKRETEEDFLKALELLEYLLDKYKIKCFKGPDLFEPIVKTKTEIINWLKETWFDGKYNDINYGVWFLIE